MPRLSKLVLINVGMANKECQLLASALTYVDMLRILKLSHNPLGHGSSELADHLHCVPYLKELVLENAQMGEEDVTALAHSLQNVTQMSKLKLSKNPLGHGVSELAKHLHNLPLLTEMYLNATNMGEEEVTALAHSLQNVTQLSKLDLSKNPLGHGIIELAKHLRNVPHLEWLNMNNTQMGEKEVTALAYSLQNVTQLSELDFSNNPLGHGISELAKHLLGVPRLKKLHLNDTQMGEEEVTAVGHSLQNVTRLSELYLSNNPLGHGISELAKHLHSVSHLKDLSLADTQMGEEEVTALVRALVCLPKLIHLFLDRNPLGRGVGKLIWYLFSFRPQIHGVSLQGVQLTKKEATELCTYVNKLGPWTPVWKSDYHVSFSFVFCINFIFQLLMLVVPRNFLFDVKEPLSYFEKIAHMSVV